MARTKLTHRRRAAVPVLAVAAVMLLASCSDDGAGAETAGDGQADDPNKVDFTVGMATGGHGVDWMDGQGDVARALAEKRGWDYIEYSNEGEGPTALQNVDLFIQEGVDAMLTFSGEASVNPVLAEKTGTAGIPVVTYDIAQDGWYFVGVDNQKAGRLGGEALGQLAKERWNCQVDLVLSAEAAGVGVVNEWRTGGMREGVKNVCPDIPEGNYVSFESEGLVEVAQPAARDVLAAHPQARNILVVGINDSGVVGALQAAEQLGRDENILGWGQDGSLITGENVNPHLAGSVFYFLEGYPTYTFTEILDKLAVGEEVAMADTAENPAVAVEPCLVTAEQAADIPPMQQRIEQLAEAPQGTHMNDLFCPAN